MSKVEDTSTTVVEEEVKLEEDTLKTIVEQTKAAMKDETDEAIKAAVKKEVEEASGDEDVSEEAIEKAVEKYLKEHEPTVNKMVGGIELAADSEVAKAFENGKFSEEVAKMSAAERFYRGMRALDEETGDRALLKELNHYAIASQKDARAKLMKEKGESAVAKTGYANETTAADGAVLIPDAEFVTTVFDNLPSYGVAFQYADVRQTDRTSVRVLSLDSGLSFYSTAEGGAKTSAKLGFAKTEVSLQKYAVIVPATDELTEDAAIDYWNLVSRELTRAYAKKADELVFTDTTYGITNLTGVITENVSGAGTTITWADLLDLEAKLEDDLDTSNYKYFMRKETWYRLVETRGTANDHFIAGSLNTATGWVANINQPTTPWGTPVVFTRVLPTSNAVSSNDAFVVYGDLSNTILYNKRGMALKILDQATITDADGGTLNLGSQDATAMRAVIRLLHVCPKGNRGKFGVLGTGTVS